jgi:hypothetical protein
MTPAKHQNNRISPRIFDKKSKSLLGLSTWARRSYLKKKTRGKKSRGTVPLSPQTDATYEKAKDDIGTTGVRLI